MNKPILLTTSYWPADTDRPVLELSAGAALQRAASVCPDRVALVEVAPGGLASLTGASRTDRRWTYAELLAEAQDCAGWLLGMFEPGTRLCVWAPNVPEWVILQYGAALAGMVLVTANPALRADELRYVLRQSRSRALFHVDAFRGTDMAAIAGEVAGEVDRCIPMSRWAIERRLPNRGGVLPDVKPRDPAQIQYTSGTTGHPKGALLHHMGLVTNASYVAERLGIDASVVISPMPLFHTAGSVLSVLGCCTTFSTLVLPLLFDPAMILAAIERERARYLFGVPTMVMALIEQQRRQPVDLSSLKYASTGGAPVPAELVKRVRSELRCGLLAVYGQTEASPIICQTSPDDAIADQAGTAGRPLSNVEVRIANPGTGEVMPLGIEGEIQARGYQVMLEYFDEPQATRLALSTDGWLRTGDLGTMDGRGYVRVTGRLKDMIIRGGENIYPAEVEARLLEHPSVADASVFGLTDAHWGEIVAAAVRLRPDALGVTAEELKTHCRVSIAPAKTPARWFIVDSWPMTASGKIQKFRLREMAESAALKVLQ